MVFLSIVSPVYNTGNMLQELVVRLTATAGRITDTFEIILIDDGSTDASWKTIVEIAQKNPLVHALKLSRNFGQHAAIAAGLQHAKGNWIAVLDSDLQDTPETLLPMYEETKNGFSIVLAKRLGRTDPLLRRMHSRIFYKMLSWLSGIPADHSIANFGLYSRQVIDQVKAMSERHPFFPMMVNWVGFKKTSIPYTHAARALGRSGYDFRKLSLLALDTTLSYSDKPLRYVVKLGFVISAVSFIYGIIILIRYATGRISVLGYTSLILSIWFLGGLILFTLGIVGLYTGKTFEEVKKRPLYIVEEILKPSS